MKCTTSQQNVRVKLQVCLKKKHKIKHPDLKIQIKS